MDYPCEPYVTTENLKQKVFIKHDGRGYSALGNTGDLVGTGTTALEALGDYVMKNQASCGFFVRMTVGAWTPDHHKLVRRTPEGRVLACINTAGGGTFPTEVYAKYSYATTYDGDTLQESMAWVDNQLLEVGYALEGGAINYTKEKK